MTLRILLATLLLAGAIPRAAAETYLVAEGGSDANDGVTAPWATLQRAANEVAAGDTVRVGAGSYVGFDLRRSGTAQAPVRFLADPGATIDRRNATTPDGINIENASYVVIEGFTLVGLPRAGIRAAVCQQVTLRRNRADQNGRWGIFTGFCDDLLIEDNECSRSAAEHGIYVSNSGDRPVIRRNRIWGNHANGIHMNGDLSQGGDGIISGALVEGNVIWDNGAGGGSGINGDGVQGSVIRNNLLHGNHASGISLYRIDGAQGSRDNVIVNNTVVQASDARWALNIQDASTGNTVRNNILVSAHPSRGSIDISADSLPGLVSDHNAVMDRFTRDGGNTIEDLATWRQQTAQDAHSFVATEAELFVAPDQGDFHLRAGSPAEDTGTATGAPAADLEGTARPQGAGFDVGAYERCVGPCAGADAGAPTDGGTPADGGTVDGGDASPDGGGTADGGATDGGEVGADAGVMPDGGAAASGGGGCGCDQRAAPWRGGGPWLVLLGTLLWGSMRRRRRGC